MLDTHDDIAAFDPAPWTALEDDRRRQEEQIELVASENHASARVKGNAVVDAPERANMTRNKNGERNDPEKPTVTSGIRLGTVAGRSRGFGLEEFRKIGGLIGDVLDAPRINPVGDAEVEAAVRARVPGLCRRFPIYGGKHA